MDNYRSFVFVDNKWKKSSYMNIVFNEIQNNHSTCGFKKQLEDGIRILGNNLTKVLFE